jgi:hypothetical protein
MKLTHPRRSLITALVCVAPLISAIAASAQPALVGHEFRVNQSRESLQLAPVAAFGSADNCLIVWESDIKGILGRFYASNGRPTSAEITLVANRQLPTIPARGEVLLRKHPAVVFLPGGEFLLFWTEELDSLSIDHFYEDRHILEQSVRGQRFSAAGKPVEASFAVSPPGAGFQRRPHAVLSKDSVIVVWEGAEGWRTSLTVSARLLSRRGQARSAAVRLDAGQGLHVRDVVLASNTAGDVLAVWETTTRDGDFEVVARPLDRNGTVAGPELVASASSVGRQRRPAVIATLGGDFLVAWQSWLPGGQRYRIFGQLVSPAGVAVGSERQLSTGVGEDQIAPALALLPSGDVIATWLDWVGATPIGIYAVVVDDTGLPLGPEVRVSEDRVYPQYQNAVAASPRGTIFAAWESRLDRGRGIAARRLAAP